MPSTVMLKHLPMGATRTPTPATPEQIKAARDRVNDYSYYGVHVGAQEKDRVDAMRQALKSRKTKGRKRCIQVDRFTTVEELNSLMPRTKSGKHEPKKIIRGGA